MTRFALTPEELKGDVPAVCPVTGSAGSQQSAVWFAHSPAWAWLPLVALLVVGLSTGREALLVGWWLLGALAVPVLTSRAATGQMWLDDSLLGQMAVLRRRRFALTMSGLMLTWPSVGLWLLELRAAALVVLVIVLGCYVAAVAMAVVGRVLTVRGRPLEDGGVALTDPHPAFIDAVELRRTGHRPDDPPAP